ncbi:pectin methylesterase [Penicillium angulare]|uniref:pectin methylesterase n=1 Tax=Penicillium angulare TaxID=116970 RepID=UPI00253FC442|nr:pectin methylesterase [Penicillium angulare]KAJ5259224.1 pectin methylesterase [Penicillium angulare]
MMALDSGRTINQTIFIKAGVYDEQVEIPTLRGRLTILGETWNTSSYSENRVTVTHNISAGNGDGDETATIRNAAAASRIYNINVANTYGPGYQGLALSATGTQQGYYGCQFQGHNRTIRTQVGGTVLFARGLISGTTDIIFGDYARVWLDHVDIKVRQVSQKEYVTANCRGSPDDPSYFVINNSTIEVSQNWMRARSAFLGRPEGSYARVVFQNTYMSNIVNAAGWAPWSSALPNTAHVMFGEYGNTGPGSQGTRASFATALESPVAIADLLDDDYESWVDVGYLKI